MATNNINAVAKDFEDSDSRDHAVEALKRTRTDGSVVTMSPEQFERLYLQPQGQVKGDLRKTFGNPTPVALGGFIMCLTPLSCQLMGWRGSGQLGSAMLAFFYFIGGPCLWLGAILEFILGNTFSFVVFFIYGGILFGWAGTLTPSFNAQGAFAEDGSFLEGKMAPQFYSSLAFQVLAAAMLSALFLIGALRINLVFVGVFFTVTIGFCLLTAAFWEMGLENMELYTKLVQGCGGCWFACSMLGWYLFFVQVMDAVGFKWPLPVGDLSAFWARREATSKPGGEV